MPLGNQGNVIRLSKSCLSSAEKAAVMATLDREFLGMGAEVQEFERELSNFFGRPALCVTNGTAALQLALQAAGVGAGDEVLVPSLTYVASFQAISATGAKPIACDVKPDSLCLDWRDAELRVTERTKAIMPVHYSGGVTDLPEITSFAKRNRLRLIEDAAHAFGTVFEGKRVGSFGDIACFSFDGIKNITSGEGGCVVTDDTEVLARIRDARLLGVEQDTERRFAGQRSWEFDVTAQGWRYHMSNIMAAIGLEQLKRFSQIAVIRQSLASLYDELLSEHPRIKLMNHDYDEVVPHIYVIRITGIQDRNALRDRLQAEGIQTGVHYQPNHRLTLYRESASAALPITEAIYPELLTLPLHADLTREQVDFICRTLKELLA
jgi:dTDP-4-amino-4,6-dideoxygalactose transaminase